MPPRPSSRPSPRKRAVKKKDQPSPVANSSIHRPKKTARDNNGSDDDVVIESPPRVLRPRAPPKENAPTLDNVDWGKIGMDDAADKDDESYDEFEEELSDE